MAESLMDRVNQLGVPQPTTALGAASIGATPQQAAMAGTQAAKKAVIKKEQTLAGAQRLEQPSQAEPTETMRAAEKKAKDIQQVGGSLTNRMSTAVQQQLNTVSSQEVGKPQVNQTALGSALGLTGNSATLQQNPTYMQASTALLSYANNPDSTSRENTLNTLRSLGIPDNSIQELLTVTAQAVGQQAAAPVAKPLTVADMDLTGIAPNINNIDQLATFLGMSKEELSKVSTDQLPTVIQDIQQREASTAQNIRAQIASLPQDSQQAQILTKQLQQIEGSGVAQAEAQVTKTIKDLQLADEIEIGGQNYTAQDLFEDNQLSDIITNWMLASPDKRGTIINPKEYPGLVNWLTKNEAALGDLVNKTSETVKTDAESITAQEKAAYNITPAGQLDAAGYSQVNDIIKGLPPEVQSKITSLPTQTIIDSYEAGNILTSDPLLQDFLGIQIGNGLITSEVDRAKIAQYKPIMDAMRSAGLQDSIYNPEFKQLQPKDMLILAQAPNAKERMAALTSAYNIGTEANRLISANPKDATTLQQLIGTIVGNENVNIDNLNNQYRSARNFAALGDKDAQARMKLLEDTFGFSSKNPTLGEAQAKLFQGKLKSIKDSNKLSDIINGKLLSPAGLDFNKAVQNTALEATYTPATGTLFSKFAGPLADGKLTEDEIRKAYVSADREEMKKLVKTLPNSKEYVKMFNSIADDVSTKTAEKQAAATIKALGSKKSLAEFSSSLNSLTPAGMTDKYRDFLDKFKSSLVTMGKEDWRLKPWADAMLKTINDKVSSVEKIIKKETDKDIEKKQQEASRPSLTGGLNIGESPELTSSQLEALEKESKSKAPVKTVGRATQTPTAGQISFTSAFDDLRG